MTEERAIYEVPGQTQIRQGCLVPFADPDYLEPTGEEIRTALRIGGFTGSVAGQLLGVSGRTVRKWTGGERAMPYSAWRLLLILIGIAIDDETQMAADAPG